MVDNTKIHTENGLVQQANILNSGFKITVSIATGVAGESTCLIIRDTNLYPDDDSRSVRDPQFIIPMNYVDDLNDICKLITKSIKERNKTLKKKKK